MTALYDFLVERVFAGFLRRCPEMLSALDGCVGDLHLRDEELVFTLPALHAFVCRAYVQQAGVPLAPEEGSFKRFRKALYAQPTNDLLREWGGRVEVASANRDHHLSRYKLVRLALDENQLDPP